MKLTIDEFKKISDLEDAIIEVNYFTDVLLDYNGEKGLLIDVLVEKSQIMLEKMEAFMSDFIK